MKGLKIINRLVKEYFLYRKRRIQHIRKNALKDQKNIFQSLIEVGRKTKYWQENNLNNITNYEAFRKLPIQSYDGLKPYIERAISGESDVLWRGKTKWYAKSSGTTNDKSKFIPITQRTLQRNHYRAGNDLYASFFASYPKSKIHFGRNFIIGGSQKIISKNNNSMAGDISSILIKNLPQWTKMYAEPGKNIMLLEKWEDKLEKIVQTCSKKDITFISGAPSWGLIILQKILKNSGKKYLNQVWKNFSLIIYGGMSIENYRQKFAQLLEYNPIFFQVYNASEGFFGFQDQAETTEMLLLTDHDIFYEFRDMSDEKIVPLWEVEINKIYSLIITSSSGLWRYEIGDTISFCSLHPFRFEFVGRTQLFINTFGEEVTIANTEKALSIINKKLDSIVHEYLVAPKLFKEKQGGVHQWLIEFEKQPEDIKTFALLLDKEMQKLNSDYEAKRQSDILLKNLEIQVLPQGTFFNWMKQKKKLGGQNKVPRLSNNRKNIEEILATLKENT